MNRPAKPHRNRTITWSQHGGTSTLTLPDLEIRGIKKIGFVLGESRIPGTKRWEWAVTNMPVSFVTGMTAGYARTRWGALWQVRCALHFWASYGYAIDWTGAPQPKGPRSFTMRSAVGGQL